jgi:Tol biopolymer transport system component
LVAAAVVVAAAFPFAGAAGNAANSDHAGSESLIAFTRSLETPNGDEYASHIYVVRPDGTGLRALTRGSALDGNPAWSRDGKRIAFDRQHDVDDFDLCIMNANGSGVRCLGQAGTKPAWSPDGKRLAYAFGGDIYVIGTDGSGRRKVTGNVALDSNDPAWSPDGKTIALDAYRGLGKAQVYLINVKGGRLRRLTHSAFHLWEPA